MANDVARATVQLRAEHKQETRPLQLAVDRLTAVIGRPDFVAALSAGIAVWIGWNLLAPRIGLTAPDPPPFVWLLAATSIGALFMAALILTTQRREDQLANHQAQLILELAILNDQKTSKIVELLEEIRRDTPAIFNRVDVQAEAMSTPADTQAVLVAIKDVGADLD